MNIALAGNPNCGKTTVFNDLTGAQQYVGNWPGVTVEKKEGKLKGNRDVKVTDLPGIYSLSPYSLEEVIARKFLIEEQPDVIINIVDASNLERNLYLTTQLLELGRPMIVALNMMDVVRKNGDKIDTQALSRALGCPVTPISAVKGEGMKELVRLTLERGKKANPPTPLELLNGEAKESVKKMADILEGCQNPPKNLHWYAVKALEGDEEALGQIKLSKNEQDEILKVRQALEQSMDDDAESIVTNARYEYIGEILTRCYKKNRAGLTLSDKIDKVVTNRWLALPIFFGILWLIYYVSITTIGDWTIGWVEAFFGWIQGGAESLLVGWGASEAVIAFVVDGIIGGVSAIFIYVPQLMILFFFLSLLEDSGYMARVAFIMDRLFRKFGLSGKSFIPMLIGTGCSVPGIMASRTIENEKDRKMTIMLTPFIPCGAKLPVFAMFAAMLFPEESWVGPSIYLIAIVGVIVSGLILKRTKRFKGDPAPFVMELPAYKLPRPKGVAIHMWDRAKSFIKKAGTIIFVACAVLWVLQNFNWSFQYLGAEGIDQSILASIGNAVKWIFVPLGFGDSWAPAVASITGLVAKEVVVSTFATVGATVEILFTQVSAYAFMVFTIFAAPCFAAIGAMKRELGNWKDTWFAIGYQLGVAYVLGTLVNLIGGLIFRGTPAMTPQALDYSAMEEASESAVINGDIVLIVFGAILVIALVWAICYKLHSRRKYAVKEA